jgi:hypothetical protein
MHPRSQFYSQRKVSVKNLDLNPDPNPDSPNPHVFRPPGSGSESTSYRYGNGSGSGSFYHQAKLEEKPYSYYFVTSFWTFLFEK